MESYSLFKFAVRKESEVESQKVLRLYQFELQPGSPWEEIQASLDEFKVEFLKLQEQAKSKESEQSVEADASEQDCNTAPVEAELVS